MKKSQTRKPARRGTATPKSIKDLIIKLAWKNPKNTIGFLLIALSIIIFALTCQFKFKSKYINIEKDKLDAKQIKVLRDGSQRKR